MTKEDVEITLNEGVLTVDAKNTVDEKEAGKWHLRERNYSQQQITRSWSIPAGATQENIKARLDNGVLTISYPKPEEEPVKRISIEWTIIKRALYEFPCINDIINNDIQC